MTNHSLLWILFFSLSVNSNDLNQTAPITELQNIKQFDKSELHTIKHRYDNYRHNKQLFTPYQFITINEQNLAPILKDLIIHPNIKLSDTDATLSFATEIKKSGLDLLAIEKRIEKYLDQGESIFSGLRKAIDRELFHRYKTTRILEVKNRPDPFMNIIAKLSLSEEDHSKILNTYAICIDSFNYDNYRNSVMKPKICNAINEYPSPRNFTHGVSVRESLSETTTKETTAYHALVLHAKSIADNQQLNYFERVMMAKCIAEQSLRFFEPSRHPLKALRKTCEMDEKSPEETFFMQTGVCGNFSAIAYNIANQLGLKNDIFLARNGLHIYLEFRERGIFYHAHPFNNKSPCDIIRFRN